MSKAGNFEIVSLAELTEMGLATPEEQHRPVVLVVDDDQIIADTRAAIFTGWGYAAITAYSAETALELVEVIPPELLVSDVILIGMNGVELAIAIQAIVPDCKVLLLSSLPPSTDMLVCARDAGRNFTFLDKPLHPDQLFVYLSKLNMGLPGAQETRLEAGIES